MFSASRRSRGINDRCMPDSGDHCIFGLNFLVRRGVSKIFTTFFTIPVRGVSVHKTGRLRGFVRLQFVTAFGCESAVKINVHIPAGDIPHQARHVLIVDLAVVVDVQRRGDGFDVPAGDIPHQARHVLVVDLLIAVDIARYAVRDTDASVHDHTVDILLVPVVNIVGIIRQFDCRDRIVRRILSDAERQYRKNEFSGFLHRSVDPADISGRRQRRGRRRRAAEIRIELHAFKRQRLII